MAGLSYEEGKKQAYRGFILLGIITIAEVLIALVGNGHVIDGFELPRFIMYPIMIGLSLYKAYFIVNEFMHMKYEVKGLAMSVVLPTLLLTWAIVAFLQEGGSWGDRRELIKEKDQKQVQESNPTGMMFVEPSELTGELRAF
ncbi:MAG: cytochrome C oxidase subunit IV family protein [Saprospiraceae bacterium]